MAAADVIIYAIPYNTANKFSYIHRVAKIIDATDWLVVRLQTLLSCMEEKKCHCAWFYIPTADKYFHFRTW